MDLKELQKHKTAWIKFSDWMLGATSDNNFFIFEVFGRDVFYELVNDEIDRRSNDRDMVCLLTEFLDGVGLEIFVKPDSTDINGWVGHLLENKFCYYSCGYGNSRQSAFEAGVKKAFEILESKAEVKKVYEILENKLKDK